MSAMFAIGLKILAALGPIAPILQRVFNASSGVLVAVIAAIPPTIEATGKFLDYVSKNALAAFLLGCCMLGPAGFLYGLSWDAPLRERAKLAATQSAKDAANRQAALAIANATREASVRIATAERERDAAKAALAKATKKR